MKSPLPILCTLALTLSAAFAAPDKPNVIVILTDDQGWGDLSISGNTNLSTPHIDSLATEGAHFDRFYVQPVCSPTRAEFLTGRYHTRLGVYSTSAGGERLNLDEKTIADTFKASGYATGAFGKWHNGTQFPYHPNARGFDEYYGFCSGHWGHYFDVMLDHNGKIVKGEGFVVDDFTDKAIDFMKEKAAAEEPFFAYLPYNTPHSPMQVPDKYWEKWKDHPIEMHNRDPEKEDELHLRCALAMCENIDDNVGRLLTTLDELEIAENTIILYFCDNGPNGVRWNGDMLGKKGSTDEGGVRSPLLIRWPGKIEAGRKVMQIGAAIDLLPTLAEMAEIEVASTKPLDGISLAPLLLESPAMWENRMLVNYWKGKASVRSQRYRYSHGGGLFDLDADPGQRKDLVEELPEIAEKMSEARTKFLSEEAAEVEALAKEDLRPFVIAHPDSPFTQIPARDGIASGGIKRSNKFPNDSFFHSWTSTEGKINWLAEVAEPGTYEVELFYTCDEENLGAKLELAFVGEGESLADAKALKFSITEAAPVALLGAEFDRSRRVESYVQDWHRVTIGDLELPEGNGELVMRATEIPGVEAMQFRMLFLTREDGSETKN